MLFATKRWLVAAKMYYFYGKNISMHLSRYEKNIAYQYVCQNFRKLCAIMRFFGIMRIMRSEPNYAISHSCNSGSPEFGSRVGVVVSALAFHQCGFDSRFSKSLIIHGEKTKEITTGKEV